jgi:hypothetical protein
MTTSRTTADPQPQTTVRRGWMIVGEKIRQAIRNRQAKGTAGEKAVVAIPPANSPQKIARAAA